MSFTNVATYLEIATPSTPGADKQRIYPKPDGFWYTINDAGIETLLGGGGTAPAPATATYITQTPNSGLSAEQALSLLSTGFMFVTTATGVITSIGSTGTGSVVLATSPTLVTPNIGAATGTSLSVSDSASTNVISGTYTGASGASGGAIFGMTQDDGAAIASGDRLGFYSFRGSTDALHTLAAPSAVSSFATEAWSGSANGADLRFGTTRNTTTTLATRLTLQNTGVAIFAAKDTRTNTVLNSLFVSADTDGTPAAGLGTGVVLASETSTTEAQSMARFRSLWTVVTHASRATRSVLSAFDSAAERDIVGFGANGSAGLLGFFPTVAAAPVVQQTSGANLTNNVTSGGTDDTIANFTDLTTYANDAAAIRNDIYQIARKLKQLNDGLRTYGLFT